MGESQTLASYAKKVRLMIAKTSHRVSNDAKGLFLNFGQHSLVEILDDVDDDDEEMVKLTEYAPDVVKAGVELCRGKVRGAAGVLQEGVFLKDYLFNRREHIEL